MDLSLIPVLAVFSLFAVSSLAYFAAKKTRIPHTVILVALGVCLVLLSNVSGFEFLKTFTLTPELLFYIFLPTLLFEAAYNINIRTLTQNAIPVFLLAVGSLLVSTCVISGALFYLLPLVGFPMPFSVVFIFGALISATDPVAVLALFKDYGAPRRLRLLFEGESLFNDGTSFALFLIALEFAVKGGFSAGSMLEGLLSFAVMLAGGGLLGLIAGGIFTNILSFARSSESVSITLTLVTAHVTFLLSELISSHLHWGSFRIYFSSIIATAIAAMVIGNYGRTKLPFGAEEFIEKFWEQIAFFANSIVFILVGMFAVSLPISSPQLFLPIGIAILVVAAARAISVYPVLGLWNAAVKTVHDKIPLEWQHLLAWGSLRGALAVTMALMIPPTLMVSGWQHDMSIQSVILAFTTGCIFVTLFFKATTIGALMNVLRIGRLTDIETAQYDESRALVYARVLDRLDRFAGKGYIPDETHRALRDYYTNRLKESNRDAGISEEHIARAVLRIWVLGIERRAAKDLFEFGELSEHGYKRILSKLTVRREDAERGDSSSQIHIPRYMDILEHIADRLRRMAGRMSIYQDPTESYMYYRAFVIIARKVTKELARIGREQSDGMFSPAAVSYTKEIYRGFTRHSANKMREITERHPAAIAALSEKLARSGVLKVEERALDELIEYGMITQKVHKILHEELEREAAHQG